MKQVTPEINADGKILQDIVAQQASSLQKIGS